MEDLLKRITFNSDVLQGKPLIRGMRISVEMILELLAKGSTEEEILQEIQVPNLPPSSKGRYLKLTPRRSMDLAIVGVAVVIVPEQGICKDIRIGLGAVAPTPIRAKEAEGFLRGQGFDDGIIERAAQIAADESRPIDDQRASAEYRREMVKVLTKRAIHQTLSSS